MALVQQLKKSWSLVTKQNRCALSFFKSLQSLGWILVIATHFFTLSFYRLIWFQAVSLVTMTLNIHEPTLLGPTQSHTPSWKIKIYSVLSVGSSFSAFGSILPKFTTVHGHGRSAWVPLHELVRDVPSMRISPSGSLSTEQNLHTWLLQPWQEFTGLPFQKSWKRWIL